MIEQSKFMSTTPFKENSLNTIENQIALSRVAKKSRKITEFFQFIGDQEKISSQIELEEVEYNAHLNQCNYQLLIKNLKNNYKMKELQCLKYENEIYEFKHRIKKLVTQTAKFAETNTLLQ